MILIGGIALLALCVPAIIAIDPRAKDWAADIIAWLAAFSVAELRARAMAQRAARVLWRSTYNEALREAKGAGNWSPAARAACDEHKTVAAGPPCAVTVPLEVR